MFQDYELLEESMQLFAPGRGANLQEMAGSLKPPLPITTLEVDGEGRNIKSPIQQEAISNKCLTSSNKCLTTIDFTS